MFHKKFWYFSLIFDENKCEKSKFPMGERENLKFCFFPVLSWLKPKENIRKCDLNLSSVLATKWEPTLTLGMISLQLIGYMSYMMLQKVN